MRCERRRVRSNSPAGWAGLALALLACAACSSTPGGDGGTRDGGGGDGTTGGDGGDLDIVTPSDGNGWVVQSDGRVVVSDTGVTVMEDGGTRTCFPVSCAGHVLECGDCDDNDHDGFIDDHDPECLGPCDNTEGPVLLTGVGGETGGPCGSDCYFDFGNGPGNDDCHWDHRCDPLSVAPDYNPEGMGCALEPSRVGSRDCPANQSMMCLDYCRPITPNGCDCFGCCTFPELAGRGPGGGPGYVWLGSYDGLRSNGTCTIADVTNPQRCRPCTPVQSCFNECGRCEVCIGRPMPPADCFMTPSDGGTPTDGGTPPSDGGTNTGQCMAGVQPCGLAGQAPCPFGFYCITGCCQAAPP